MKLVVHGQSPEEQACWRRSGLLSTDMTTVVAYATQLLADAALRQAAIAKDQAAVAAVLEPLGLFRYYGDTPYRLWMRKSGLQQSGQTSTVAEASEPRLRAYFERRHHELVVPVLAEHEAQPFLRAELSGLTAAGEPIFLSCPTWQVYQAIDKKGVLPYFYPQMQHQMLVAEANQAIFMVGLVRASDGKILRAKEIRVARDAAFIDSMSVLAHYFWNTYVLEGASPPLTPDLDIIDMSSDETWTEKAAAWHQQQEELETLQAKITAAKSNLDALQQELAALVPGGVVARGAGVSYHSRVTRGAIDYQAALAHYQPALTGSNELETFRKKSRKVLVFTKT